MVLGAASAIFGIIGFMAVILAMLPSVRRPDTSVLDAAAAWLCLFLLIEFWPDIAPANVNLVLNWLGQSVLPST